MNGLTESTSWKRLAAERERLGGMHMRELFAQDPGRAQRYSTESCGIFLDYSKQRISDATLDLLLELAAERGVAARREQMFRGEHINTTEDRAVLHTALRDRSGARLIVDGVDVAEAVRHELRRMADFAQAIRSGDACVADGQAITDVVNIGIGGSDLGPKAVCAALEPYCEGVPALHFLSNPDSHAARRILSGLDPAHTLVIVSSKTFTTQETLTNFATARAWMAAALGSEAQAMARFVAVTASPDAAQAQGFAPERTFRFWDWVGGRYSLWSAIGLPIMLAIGPQRFDELLSGAYEMDRHFRETEPRANLPLLLALLGIWNANFLGARTQLVAPYDERLRSVPAYIQQLDMESNGKRFAPSGDEVRHGTGPVIWGDLGINGQHAFFQLVHQGTHLVPVDFIGVVHAHQGIAEHQRVVYSNMLAQAEALMVGRTFEQTRRELIAAGMREERADALVRQRSFPGNVPSNTLLLERLTPATLGALIALYEHKVFVQGVIWGINSFDQWGVELGKQLGKGIYGELKGEAAQGAHDASTAALIARLRAAWSAEQGR